MQDESSETSTPPWKNPDAIASQMEDLVWGMMEAINTRSFEAHPSSEHFAPDAIVELGKARGKTDLETHYDDVRKRLDAQPGTVISSLSNCSSSVDLKTGFACLLCTMDAIDPCNGLRREQATVFVWRLHGTKWLCEKYTGIQGVLS